MNLKLYARKMDMYHSQYTSIPYQAISAKLAAEHPKISLMLEDQIDSARDLRRWFVALRKVSFK